MCPRPSLTPSEERNHVYPEQRYKRSRADKESRHPKRGMQANQVRRPRRRQAQGSRGMEERRSREAGQERRPLEARQGRRPLEARQGRRRPLEEYEGRRPLEELQERRPL